jgi:hypothetical protein
MMDREPIPPRDARIDEPLALWDRFVQRQPATVTAVVYHGDVDGAIGAAYGRLALLAANQSIETPTHWVGTEEYDFGELRRWLGDLEVASAAFFDISLENSPAVIDDVLRAVENVIFVFDHHIVTAHITSDRVFVANPTPTPVTRDQPHVPTFLFARELADRVASSLSSSTFTASIVVSSPLATRSKSSRTRSLLVDVLNSARTSVAIRASGESRYAERSDLRGRDPNTRSKSVRVSFSY